MLLLPLRPLQLRMAAAAATLLTSAPAAVAAAAAAAAAAVRVLQCLPGDRAAAAVLGLSRQRPSPARRRMSALAGVRLMPPMLPMLQAAQGAVRSMLLADVVALHLHTAKM